MGRKYISKQVVIITEVRLHLYVLQITMILFLEEKEVDLQYRALVLYDCIITLKSSFHLNDSGKPVYVRIFSYENCCRLQLAALHYNANSDRQQATTK